MVKYFSSTLADLADLAAGSFSRCLEQLFCRKPISACFLRKELHSRVKAEFKTPLKPAFCKFVNF